MATATDATTERPLRMLRDSLASFAGSFDATALCDESLESVVADAAKIVSMATTVKGKAARARSLRSSSSPGSSAAQDLAQASGTSLREARDELKAAEAMEKHPELDDAASSGSISPRQVALIAQAADANPQAVEPLVQAAQSGTSLSELSDRVGQARAAGDRDPEATRARLHRSRSLRHWTDAEGHFHLHLKDLPDRGAEVLSAVEPLRDFFFHQARRNGTHEPPEAYGADALVELARRSMAAQAPAPGPAAAPGPGSTPTPTKRAPAKVIIRVDYETLHRGYPIGDEICEVAGVGPISPQAVGEWLLQPDSFLAAVVTKATQVAGVVHSGRQPTAQQRTALEWLYATCSVEGCGARSHLEIDHIVDWSISHKTKLEDLGPLCRPHHRKKTEEGWMLVNGIGSRAFVAPQDPRHPLFKNGKAGWRPRYGKYRARGRAGPGDPPERRPAA